MLRQCSFHNFQFQGTNIRSKSGSAVTYLIQILIVCQLPQQHLIVLVGCMPIRKGLVTNLPGFICVLLSLRDTAVLHCAGPLLTTQYGSAVDGPTYMYQIITCYSLLDVTTMSASVGKAGRI